MDIEKAKQWIKESPLCYDCEHHEYVPQMLIEAAQYGSKNTKFFKEYGTHGYSLLLEELILRSGEFKNKDRIVSELRRGMTILNSVFHK